MSLNPEYSPEPRRSEPPPQRIPPEPYQPGPEAYHTETEKHGPEFDPQPGTEPNAPALPPETAPAVTGKTSLGTRTGWTWVGLIASALILIVLLVFILQNLNSVRVGLLFWEFNLPIGIAVLLSAIGGALLMATVGGLRILQLRRAVKR
ncbi:lipopolysaccharide assembly LapA domain-containing protein [Nocardia sp. XZ_19_385]|uniref:LapA family protein n=1 Tax=Nocardia sp. XZ_19_385 TaxID=2769488 RepID=UPI00188DF0F8|nr:lipopolysaccharide assembly protein LapA domain-containing protein [Nocardia sp. XZ_19_385]